MRNAMPSDVDLTNCDREPIHIPGSIQSFGYLVALSADWVVTRASANIAALLDAPPADLLGQPIGAFVCADTLHTIRNHATMLRGADAIERIFGLPFIAEGPLYNIAVHFAGDVIVIEAEPATVDTGDAALLVRSMMSRLRQAAGMPGLFREAARQIRALTAFDRVMVYRFDSVSGSGEVVAEAVGAGIDSFLGLNYPASDIPVQARALYLRSTFRVIADVKADAVPIVPALDIRGNALDQSVSILRAVSPIHLEYLGNMGVAASLSISIVVEGRLWGLIACHHYQPRLPSFAQRSAAELFGQMFSMTLESRERDAARVYETQAREIGDRLMASVAQDGELLTDAEWLGDIIFGTIPADGVGVFIDGRIALSGLTPPRAAFQAIVGLLNQISGSQIFTTEHLASVEPGAADYALLAAGMIAIPLSRSPRDYVVLFRKERQRAMRWGGHLQKEIEHGPNGARLTPRKSFEEWSELVKGQCLPFTTAEVRVAEMLRVALLEVLLRISESTGVDRRRAHEHQSLLIAELNHRVRNILSLIRGLISQTRGSALSTEAFVETLDDRVQALARAHDQITADRWGPARLIDLIHTESGAYLGGKRDRVIATGPNVLIDPTAFSVLALVFHELITNCAKYGALSDGGIVRIDWRIGEEGALEIDWVESGGPAVAVPTRRGFGSTIIEDSVPYDLSGTASILFCAAGVEARFCIPSRFVASVLPDALPPPASHAEDPTTNGLLRGEVVLLVEDSMIVALDGECLLQEMGAAQVVTAATVERALDAIDRCPVSFAVLDFNLGAETSVAVAEALFTRGVPFVFATGYGDALDLPERLRKVGVLKKPYNGNGLAAAIAAMR